MTIKRAKIVAAILGVIIGVLTWIIVFHDKIGELHLNTAVVFCTIVWIGAIAFVSYFFLGIFWIQHLQDKENLKK